MFLCALSINIPPTRKKLRLSENLSFMLKMDCEAGKSFTNSQCSAREQTTCCDLTKLLPHMLKTIPSWNGMVGQHHHNLTEEFPFRCFEMFGKWEECEGLVEGKRMFNKSLDYPDHFSQNFLILELSSWFICTNLKIYLYNS